MHITSKLNKWSYFDSTINNHLVEQRKIVDRKNYEQDSRAYALKDYGYQPFLQSDLNKQKEIKRFILSNRTPGNENGNELPSFKLNYTPITKYQKLLIDAKVKPQGSLGR